MPPRQKVFPGLVVAVNLLNQTGRNACRRASWSHFGPQEWFQASAAVCRMEAMLALHGKSIALTSNPYRS